MFFWDWVLICVPIYVGISWNTASVCALRICRFFGIVPIWEYPITDRIIYFAFGEAPPCLLEEGFQMFLFRFRHLLLQHSRIAPISDFRVITLQSILHHSLKTRWSAKSFTFSLKYTLYQFRCFSNTVIDNQIHKINRRTF